MLRELSVARFQFDCSGCGYRWTVDYDVQHVEDGRGLVWDGYSLHGCPAAAPTARGVVCCPRCQASLVHVELIATVRPGGD